MLPVACYSAVRSMDWLLQEEIPSDNYLYAPLVPRYTHMATVCLSNNDYRLCINILGGVADPHVVMEPF